MKKEELIGVWKLINFEITWPQSNKVTYPYGENPVGYLIYTLDGYVSAQFMSSKRELCLTADYKNTTPSEKMEMADNYGGYVGRYKVRGSSVIHYPEVCIFPNFIQVPQERECDLQGDQLTLSCAYLAKEGEEARSSIVWKKVPPTIT